MDSPSSLWEGVNKFHYPPRCPRARLATAGSKAYVDRSASLSTHQMEYSPPLLRDHPGQRWGEVKGRRFFCRLLTFPHRTAGNCMHLTPFRFRSYQTLHLYYTSGSPIPQGCLALHHLRPARRVLDKDLEKTALNFPLALVLRLGGQDGGQVFQRDKVKSSFANMS